MSDVPSSNDAFDLTKYRDGLKTNRFGHPTEYWPRVNSTNDKILDMARRGAPEGTVALANEQFAGRGRQGNTWHSPPGLGIWASILLRPRQVPMENLSSLTLCAGYAVSLAIEQGLRMQPQIKWPNDVMLGDRKVAGMLMESKTLPAGGIQDEGPCVILGIGINVNQTMEDFPESLHQSATSIQIETGWVISRESLLCLVLKQLETTYHRFLKNGFTQFLTEIKSRLAWRGRLVELTDESYAVQGRLLDIEDDGSLLLDTNDEGWVAMYSGSIRLIQ